MSREKNRTRDGGWTRREVLRTLGGTSFGLAGVSAAIAEEGNPVNIERLRSSAWLTGLEVSDADGELMLEDIAGTLEGYQTLRQVPLDNSVPPSLHFDPAGAAAPDEPDLLAPLPSPDREPSGDLDVAFAGIRELAGWLRSGRISSVELTELYLERLSRIGPKLECVIEETREIALAAARRADEERSRDRDQNPLHGIPWGAKDLLAYPGTRTTWGARPYQDQRIEEKATVAARLDRAGSPLLAKLTLGALAWGDVWFGGTTKNPWNPEQGSSGSSAGPAAATAAGLCPFAIGSETWGSIVSPSTRCGVTGLRPTFGRVSRAGAMALSWSMDKLGPMARSAEDCALVLATIEGADGLDATVRPRPRLTWPPRPVRELRVGFVPEAFERDRGEGIEDEAVRQGELEWQRNDDQVLEIMRKAGLTLRPVSLPKDIPVGPLSTILTAEATAAFDDLTRSGRDDDLVRQERYAWPNVFRQGQLIPAVEYIRANRVRTLLRAAWEEALRDVDVLVSPSFGGDLLLATNLTGHPALCLPNGFRQDGTPTSITFTGKLFGESDLVSLGMLYQAETDHHRQRPPIATG